MELGESMDQTGRGRLVKKTNVRHGELRFSCGSLEGVYLFEGGEDLEYDYDFLRCPPPNGTYLLGGRDVLCRPQLSQDYHHHPCVSPAQTAA